MKWIIGIILFSNIAIAKTAYITGYSSINSKNLYSNKIEAIYDALNFGLHKLGVEISSQVSLLNDTLNTNNLALKAKVSITRIIDIKCSQNKNYECTLFIEYEEINNKSFKPIINDILECNPNIQFKAHPCLSLEPEVSYLEIRFYTRNNYITLFKEKIFIRGLGKSESEIKKSKIKQVRYKLLNSSNYRAFASAWKMYERSKLIIINRHFSKQSLYEQCGSFLIKRVKIEGVEFGITQSLINTSLSDTNAYCDLSRQV